MRIDLRDPFSVTIDVVEIDERLPSMRCAVIVETNQIEQTLVYRDHVWISCATWDSFVEGLAANDCLDQELVDIDCGVALRVLKSAIGCQLSFEGAGAHLTGMVCKTTIQAPLHRDDLAVVTRPFADFNRWW
ncbi:hypothetical protein [Paraburkholderia aspalathi]|uniref:hypothetical protein n=1 Tax=Paraburkholderia aspalathi TaxID=1324617 RepID=UPI001BADC48B|nr:hypothetical protein [Paraburkholderia aspalathi]